MKKLIALLVFAASFAGAALAQTNDGTVDIKTQVVANDTGACTGVMPLLFPIACNQFVVSASSTDPNVIAFYVVVVYKTPTGLLEVASQTTFTKSTTDSRYFVATFGNFPNIVQVGARALIGGTLAWTAIQN